MPTFTYTSRDDKGMVRTGHLDAVDEDQAVAILQHRGLLVTSVSRKAVGTAAILAMRQRKRRLHANVTVEDQMLFCEQFATLVDAGVPILRSLTVVAAQVESRRLLTALEAVIGDVESGRALHEALAKHPRIFSNLWVKMVEIGEASGHLAESLQQLARHFESAQRLRNEAKTALTYPVVLIVVAIAVLGVFVYWVIPKFSGLFASLSIELPLVTRLVIGVSDAARQSWVALVLGAVAGGYLLQRYLRTEAGQWMWDRLVLRIPLFNTLFASVQLAEFGRGLSTLLNSGVPLLSGLEILESSATNRVYGQAIGSMKDAVKEGKSMAETMANLEVFPPMTVQMVQVGEEVGELGKMVGRVARYYEQRMETFIARMTRLFEPIATVVMAGLVLIIVLAIFLPIFQLATGRAI